MLCVGHENPWKSIGKLQLARVSRKHNNHMLNAEDYCLINRILSAIGCKMMHFIYLASIVCVVLIVY